jgi:hypothetical protein
MAAFERVSEGDVADVEHYADLAERGTLARRPGDGSEPVGSAHVLLRAMLARDGIDRMLSDAGLALDLEPVGSTWRDFALWILARAREASGDASAAEAALVEGTAAARAAGHDGLAYCLLGHRALLAMDRQDWTTAMDLTRQADAIGLRGRLAGYVSASLARIASVRLLQHRGASPDIRVESARSQPPSAPS